MTTEKLYYTLEEVKEEVIPVLKRMLEACPTRFKEICEAFNESHGGKFLTYGSSSALCNTEFYYCHRRIYTYSWLE